MKTQIAVILFSTFLQALEAAAVAVADPSAIADTTSAGKSETRVVRQSGSSSSASASSSSGGGGGYPTGGGGGGGGYAPQPSYGVPDDTNYDYGDERYNYNDGGYYRNNFPQQPFQFRFPQLNFPQIPIFPQGNSNFADFGRIGGSGNGRGVYSSSGIHAGPDGKVTTFQSNSGGPPSIQTRLGTPGKVNGVYSSSGFNVGPDGKVTSYKDSGHF